MFADEYVTCLRFETRIGTEPNPDFDEKIGLRRDNMPNRGIMKTEWIVGFDGPNNLGIRCQQSFNNETKARKAALKLAKKNGRNSYKYFDK
jgi:hypothetical protein